LILRIIVLTPCPKTVEVCGAPPVPIVTSIKLGYSLYGGLDGCKKSTVICPIKPK
jgi:hypothetical protein